MFELIAKNGQMKAYSVHKLRDNVKSVNFPAPPEDIFQRTYQQITAELSPLEGTNIWAAVIGFDDSNPVLVYSVHEDNVEKVVKFYGHLWETI